VTREAVWHQRTPDGATLAIVLLEADDVEAAFGHIVASDAPFDRRFRAMIRAATYASRSSPALNCSKVSASSCSFPAKIGATNAKISMAHSSWVMVAGILRLVEGMKPCSRG
jgi:hypothetical protein